MKALLYKITLLLFGSLLFTHTLWGQSDSCVKCGSASFSAGTNCNASAEYSIAIGVNDSSYQQNSCAIGFDLKSGGYGSVVLGNNDSATGTNSLTIGTYNVNPGSSALAVGNSNYTWGPNSIALGNTDSSRGSYSIGVGNLIRNDGSYSISLGNNISTRANGAISIGSGTTTLPLHNDIAGSIMLGANSSKPTIFLSPSPTSHGHGNVGIGTTSPKQLLDVSGNIAINGNLVIDSLGGWHGKTTGLRGPAGQNGNLWITGSQPPLSDTGNVNDLYLNTSTDSVYQKTSDTTWLGIASLSGGSGGCNLGECAAAAKQAGDSAIAAIDTAVVHAIGPTGTGGTIGGAVYTAIGAAAFGGAIGGLFGAAIYTAIGGPGGGTIGEAAKKEIEKVSKTGQSAQHRLDSVGYGIQQKVDSIAKQAQEKIDSVAGIANKKIEADKQKEDECAKAAQKAANDAKKSAEDAKQSADSAKKTMESRAGKDLFGTYPNPTVVGIQGRRVSSSPPQNGSVLAWDSKSNLWTPTRSGSYSAGTGIRISKDTISAKSTEAIWNAEKIHGRLVSSHKPANGHVLMWNSDSSSWLPAKPLSYSVGTGISISKDTISAKSTEAIWNAEKIHGRLVSSHKPANGHVLMWNSDSSSWLPAKPLSYAVGTGIRISKDTISAKSTEAIWNAEKIHGRLVSSHKPANGHVLMWNSDSSSWIPAKPVSYSAGTGIKISKDTITAKYTDAIWNAGKLQAHPISAISPKNGQVLQWNVDSNAWTPGTIAASESGWTLDSVKTDTVNLLANINGNIGIGTKHPVALFHIQTGMNDTIDSAFVVTRSGNVGIGTLPAFGNTYKLSVNGSVRAKKIVVESKWADFVFAPGYQLMPLKDLAVFIQTTHHLPGIPAAPEVESKGQNIGDIQVAMMQKIEELTLYMINADEALGTLKRENDELKKRLLLLENKQSTR